MVERIIVIIVPIFPVAIKLSPKTLGQKRMEVLEPQLRAGWNSTDEIYERLKDAEAKVTYSLVDHLIICCQVANLVPLLNPTWVCGKKNRTPKAFQRR